MEHIAISVIVPIYNTKPYLAECIESILAQKINVPIEVLLIDDGSTDGCGEVCDKYAARDERVRVIHQENQGLSAARNAGIDAAKGRYYSFIDSDDVVLPRFLQTLYDACEEHDAYMSLCSVEDVQEDGKSCDPAYFTRPTQEGVFCGKDLLNEFYTPYGTVYTVAWNKMYRAEVWKLLHYPEGRTPPVLALRQGRLHRQAALSLPPAQRQHLPHEHTPGGVRRRGRSGRPLSFLC